MEETPKRGMEIAVRSEENDRPKRVHTWREKLEHFLHSENCERFLMLLLVFDCAFVIAIMVMDAQYYNGKANDIKKHLKNCRTYGFSICEPNGTQPKYGDQELYDWEKRLHWGSVAILCVFAVEVTLLVVAKGKSYFADTDNWPFWLDFVVVWASLLVDLLATDVPLQWLIFIRLWRIVRVVHGQHHLESEHKKQAVEKVRKSVSDEMKRKESERSQSTAGTTLPE